MDDFFSPGETQAPEDDFLAREQAAGLGGDFASGTGSSFEHDFEQSASAFPDLDAAGDDGLLDSFASPVPTPGAPAAPSHSTSFTAPAPQVSITNDNEFSAFEEQYPAVEESAPEVPVQHTNGFSAPAYQQPTSVFSTPAPVEEESEFIKSWKVKQAEEIAKREEEAAKKKEETIVKAQNAIDNFYKEYNAKKEKSIAKNKEEEAAFDAERTEALAKGTTWERICTLVELQDSRSKTNTKSKQDLGRFKEILLALKREGETAPGAAGY
ncbi:clathrin light chain [Pseudohyphozyma bogoriensis]|nr:clathrin light chain [Pseudohyphozyma bogoriensis]